MASTQPSPSTDAQSQTPKTAGTFQLEVPGFGLPVNYMPSSFPDAVTSWAGDNLTVRERSMTGMMNEITDKPEWDRKVFNETIVAKWKEEALAKIDFSEQMFNYVSRLGSSCSRLTGYSYFSHSVLRNFVIRLLISPRQAVFMFWTATQPSSNPIQPSPRPSQMSSNMTSRLSRISLTA